MKRASNPDGLSTILLSSAIGGAAMQVGAVVAGKFFEKREQNPLGTLPPKAARTWEHVYESAQERGADKSSAAAQAWGAVNRQYHKEGNRWLKNPADLKSLKSRLLR